MGDDEIKASITKFIKENMKYLQFVLQYFLFWFVYAFS